MRRITIICLLILSVYSVRLYAQDYFTPFSNAWPSSTLENELFETSESVLPSERGNELLRNWVAPGPGGNPIGPNTDGEDPYIPIEDSFFTILIAAIGYVLFLAWKRKRRMRPSLTNEEEYSIGGE